MNKVLIKNKVKTYSTIFIALLLSAICYNLFLFQLNIVTGGTSGIATIVHEVLGVNQATTLFILQLFFLCISYVFLGKEKTATITIASILFPILVRVTEPLIDVVKFSTTDMFIVVIFSGLLGGFANGLMYKTGYNSGGLNVLCQILFDKFHVSLSKAVLLVNLLVVIAGGVVFGVDKAMYAIIQLYINNIIMDKVLLGISNNKAFYIITSEPDKISKYIIETLGHDTTNFDVKGGFLEKNKKVILTVIPTRDYYKVKEGINIIDNKAFFVATDSYEVKGAD